ncbi:MAG: ORF6N domain-containing protein [Ruminococcus sp.]|nr:ORF6N domain-containing protein [Ruminococcus sp.]
MYELINEKFIEIKEYKGQRVVTFKDIDTLHQRPTGTASRNFKANRQHFIEGVDFFIVKPADIQIDEIRLSEINNRGTILLTESGYLMVVKSFTDDLAWKVQRQLVNTYFRAKQQNNYSGIDQKVIIMAVKELYEKNCELNYKIDQLNNQINKLNKENRELNKNNREFTAIIKILCEKICGLYEKKQFRKSKSKKHTLI